MLRLNELALPLEHPADALRPAILARLGIPSADLLRFEIYKRGIDARKPYAILFVYTVDVEVRDPDAVLARAKRNAKLGITPDTDYKFVARATANSAQSPRPIVIGMGPTGLFAGLILAQSGFRPLILERGKAVRERTKDTFKMWRQGVLDTESNTQFGEGGAGTFSDGKLYSQVKDPKHYGRKVLREFVASGAPEEILFVSRPHIGTFRLVAMVERMRAKIIELGGEIRFESRVDEIEFAEIASTRDGERSQRVQAVVLASGERIATNQIPIIISDSLL